MKFGGDLWPGPNAINAGTGRNRCGPGTHNAGRDATASSGPSRAEPQPPPTLFSGRDSRFVARPTCVIHALSNPCMQSSQMLKKSNISMFKIVKF